jgi:hypothetical protein
MNIIGGAVKMVNSQINNQSVWNKMVHASFRKVVSFDLLFFCLGVGMGIGIGVLLFNNLN